MVYGKGGDLFYLNFSKKDAGVEAGVFVCLNFSHFFF